MFYIDPTLTQLYIYSYGNISVNIKLFFFFLQLMHMFKGIT